MLLADDVELLYRYVHDAASRGAITELMYLWAPTPWLEEQGLTIRTAINSIIASLASHFGITLIGEIEFPGFVKLYDKHVYKSAKGSPNKRLAYFAEQGNWRGVRSAINKGGNAFDKALYSSAKGGHWELVDYFTEHHANKWHLGLLGAARGGHRDIVEICIKEGDCGDYYYRTLYKAAKGGHFDLVKFFTRKGVDIDCAMEGAILGGHKEIVNYFLKNYFKNWDLELSAAARRGDWELVNFFIDKGANNWNWALQRAAEGGHQDLVEFFADKGADCWQEALDLATWRGHIEIIEYCINKQPPLKRRKYYEYAILEAIDYEQMDTILFLIGKGCHNWNKYLLNAAELEDNQFIKFFVGKGADNIDKAMKYAIKQKNVFGAKTLLKLGANLDKALQYANIHDKKKMINFLQKYNLK